MISRLIGKTGRITFLAAAFSVLTASCALADWNFTRWGMSPEEVSEAGGPQLRSATPEQTKSQSFANGDQALLVMPYDTGEFKFVAWFMFRNNRLSAVQLQLADGDLRSLATALKAKYGAPSRVRANVATWETRTDEIMLEHFVSTTLVYSALNMASTSGL